jgi:endonuclease YncB( thermonuclease family)
MEVCVQILRTLVAAAVATLQTFSAGGRVHRSELVLVKSVIDGDTIGVTTFGRVRLLGIDAPETSHGLDTAAPFGNEARDKLSRLILNRWIRLESEGPTRDIYNRHLAYAVTEDGQCINTVLVREGLARVSAREPLSRLDELKRRDGGAAVPARHLGQHPADPAAGVYSRLGRHAVPGAETFTTHERREEKETSVSAIPVEYASQRKIRERNKLYYRFNHWPIWIFVFFIAPGPLTFDLFERGFDARLFSWLAVVLIGTGIAGLRGSLPGVEPKPYIIRFTEDRPNPLYRRVCYTMAWSEAITFAVLNIAGLVFAIATGTWRLKEMYRFGYFPIAGTIWLLGALGRLPRVKASTKGEGHERRYFYGTVWAVCWAQPALWLMWKVLPRTRVGDSLKLVIFVGILAFVGNLARRGRLPRTRPIVPGELAVSD